MTGDPVEGAPLSSRSCSPVGSGWPLRGTACPSLGWGDIRGRGVHVLTGGHHTKEQQRRELV